MYTIPYRLYKKKKANTLILEVKEMSFYSWIPSLPLTNLTPQREAGRPTISAATNSHKGNCCDVKVRTANH